MFVQDSESGLKLEQSYDVNGRIRKLDAGDEAWALAFDADGRLSALDDVPVTVDDAGRVLAVGPVDYAVDTAGAVIKRGDELFSYDAFGRIVAASKSGSFNLRYAYDEAGRLRSRSGGPEGDVHFHYALPDGALSHIVTGEDGVASLDYDQDGRLFAFHRFLYLQPPQSSSQKGKAN